MAHNLEYLLTRPGILKIATIVFGILSFSIGTVAYFKSPYSEYYSTENEKGNPDNLFGTELELYQNFITGIFLGISSAYLILYGFIYELCESKLNRIIDTTIHMAGSLFIFAAGCMIIYSATEIEDYVCPNLPGFSPKSKSILFTRSSNETDKCGQFFGRKIVAGAFSILNSVIYCVTAVTVFITKDI